MSFRAFVRIFGTFVGFLFAEVADASTPAPSGPARFAHFGVEEGLPDSQVHAFLHDHQGFMWIGTRDGLARFDGYNFTVYRHDPSDPHSIGGNWVSSLREDLDGNLWVMLGVGGVDRLDRATERFEHVGVRGSGPQPGLGSNISDALVDHRGDVWFATLTTGLFRWRREDNVIENFDVPNDTRGSGHYGIFTLYEDRQQRLWLGTNGGLFLVHPEERRTQRVGGTGRSAIFRVSGLAEDPNGDLWVATNQGLWRMTEGDPSRSRWYRPGPEDGLVGSVVSRLAIAPGGRVWAVTLDGGLHHLEAGGERFIPHPADGPGGPSSPLLNAHLVDSRGYLWLGSLDAGLDRYRPEEERFERHRVTPGDPHGLASNNIINLYEDRDGGVWIGTSGGGAYVYAPWRWKFRSYHHEPAAAMGKAGHPVYSQVTAVAEGMGGKVWVGTLSNLLSLDRPTDRWRVYRHGLGPPGELPGEGVSALAVDDSGTLWVGTPLSGLGKMTPEGGAAEPFRHEPDNPESLSGNGISSLALGSQNTLWVGTLTRGFNRLHLESGRFERFPGIVPGLGQPGIWELLEDDEGFLWIGTPSFALHRFDPRSGELKSYSRQPGDPESINNRTVCSLFEDSQGRFWVGTFSGGLNRLDRAAGTFEAFTVHQGLPSNMVQSILEDEDGQLWLSTNGGLARFNPDQGTVRSFDRRDGLQHNEFATGVALKTEDGEMFFGGRGGLTRFRSGELTANPLTPPVVLTSLRVLGEEKRVGQDLSSLEAIELSHDEDVLEIEFAALDYTDPEKNRYAWKLEGFDRGWVENGTGRVATYTNLDPGEYLFRVKGSNSDGVWSDEEASLQILIRPPFWGTWWFHGLEAVAALGLLLFGFLWQRRSLEEQKRRELRRRDLVRKTEELEYARTLQLSMLPPPDFIEKNFEGLGHMVTATEVGGDYFDFINLKDGVSCLAIGDAIGHGSAAGLVVGMAKAALFQALSLSRDPRPSPEELLQGLNTTLKRALAGRAAGLGLCLVVLDDAARSAEVCSVGMPYPYHYSAAEQRLRSLELGGLPLGRRRTENMHSVVLELEPGDALILLSDGFPERLDPDDELWGYEELHRVLSALCRESVAPEYLTTKLFEACDAFARGREPEDDMTAVVVCCRTEKITIES